ncbi:MAG TPA: hypothetical protein VHE35_27980 [Kofleriaceae bacterium]|nr:hypothetical protein [Kofleriaceae bacterium]
MRARDLATVLAAVLVAGAAAGCHRHHDAASCGAVGANFMTLAQADLAASTDVDPANKRGVAGLLAPMRDSMVRACREDRWSAEARACFAAAPDTAQLRACEAKLSEPQRALLDKAASKGIQATP